MKIHWTRKSLVQLHAIHDYISENSAAYANRVIIRIIHRTEQLSQFARSGRKVPEIENDNVRELIEPPYRIIYLIKDDQIDILSVLHSARNFPSQL